jgi:hypothetical protein
MPFVIFVLRLLASMLAVDAHQPVRVTNHPPRGLGLPWLPDRSYSAFADYQRPGTTYDTW